MASIYETTERTLGEVDALRTIVKELRNKVEEKPQNTRELGYTLPTIQDEKSAGLIAFLRKYFMCSSRSIQYLIGRRCVLPLMDVRPVDDCVVPALRMDPRIYEVQRHTQKDGYSRMFVSATLFNHLNQLSKPSKLDYNSLLLKAQRFVTLNKFDVCLEDAADYSSLVYDTVEFYCAWFTRNVLPHVQETIQNFH